MGFPAVRHRRLRQNSAIRDLVRETRLGVDDFIAPLFVANCNGKEEISSLPGQYRMNVDSVLEEVSELKSLGVKGVLLFGIPDHKDETGSGSCDNNGIIQQTIKAIKNQNKEMLVVADLCFCEYTSHGHCGVIVNNDVDNDLTLIETRKQAISLAEAGADIIAPSGMMDGMVGEIRHGLDEEGFCNTSIMSYSAKYASAFYGPFREAVNSAPSFGDRRTYQMDPANALEAMREVESDIAEGADIVMIKPALSYMDIIARVKDTFSIPVAAYNVSGEYAMIKAAAEKGWIDEERVVLEMLTSLKRAGSDIIISYFTKDIAKRL
jgi:porphobilinogen synthase